MNIKDLNYFQHLIKTQSYTQTAKYFHVSQPTITQAIKRLENNLNTKLVLFHPHSASLTLTPSGQQLLLTAHKILTTWEQGLTTIERLRKNTAYLGIEPTISSRYFPSIAQKLLSAGLLKHVHVVEAGSKQLTRDVLKGKLDLALNGSSAQDITPELSIEPLKKLSFHLLLSAKHPLAHKEPSFAQALRYPFVILNNSYLNNAVFYDLVQQTNLKPNILFESASTYMISQLVNDSETIGFASELASSTLNEDLKLLPITGVNLPKLHISLIQPRGQQQTTLLSSVMTAVIDAIQEV